MKRLLILLGVSFFLSAIRPAMPAEAEIDKLPVNSLNVSVDTQRRAVRGISEITLPAGRSWEIDRAGLTILKASINGLPFNPEKDGKTLTIETGASQEVLRIEYEAVFAPASEAAGGSGAADASSITPEFIYLLRGWHPAVSGGSIYRLKAVLPAGFEAVSEAEEAGVMDTQAGRAFSFSYPHRLDSVTLVAGRYRVSRETADGVEVYAYFLPEDEGLSKGYLDHAKRYLGLYQGMLGPYPLKRFAVVENIFPTGYSFPTFTLLGRDVVRLPFITETSLGHEVLHQWLGGLVGVDYSGGNWAEGLTTYLADHYYEQEKGKGADYRKQMLISYQAYVNADNETPLVSFSSGADLASRAIGYGKAAMVFHMLKGLVGEEAFDASLKALVREFRFRQASWNDIRDVFSRTSGRDLGWFFRQWLQEKGAPDIEIRNVLTQYKGARAALSFDVVQKGGPWRMRVPVMLRMKGGEIRLFAEIEKEKTPVSVDVDDIPAEAVIDEGYDTFRRLGRPEFPPVVARLIGDRKKILVIPSGREREYETVSPVLEKEGYSAKAESSLTHDDMTGSSLLADIDSAVVRRFFAGVELPKADFSISVREDPLEGRGVAALFRLASPADLPAWLRRISHYGKYSMLSFEGGRNILKSVSGSANGIRVNVSSQVTGVQISTMVSLDDVIAKAASKDIIYVGEVHDRFEHHRVQLEVVRSLHKAGRKIAIGMEMFQRPFQQALDDYIGGIIDERTFLRRSEYFKRWGFDYNLYREIMLYAREFRIPVIALNIRKEVVSKVSKEGLNALSSEDLKEVPEDMDLTDDAYRERLRAFFERHQDSGERNFDFFYEAQVLWDESMAHNLDRFMRSNPGYQVVVLAGVGHMAFGSGIPRRAHRLNGREYELILNTDDVEKQIADFVLFPEPVRHPESPRLGVMLKEEGKKVRITAFSPHSPAEAAGLKTGDVILSIDGTAVESVEDMKIILLDKKKGDSINVRVLRERFLFGDTEEQFKITF